MQKELECLCTKTVCERRGDCVAGYRLEASMQKLPFCMRPENTASKELQERVAARLRAAGIPLGCIMGLKQREYSHALAK